tara:strand:+ start:559 stop:765 length:207 start_codon:yes stop_codon:yes gene_type:complete
MKKLVNGNLVDLTQSEKDQKSLDEQNYSKELQDFETAKTNIKNKKASGKQKLLDLGLTEEEVKALIGV